MSHEHVLDEAIHYFMANFDEANDGGDLETSFTELEEVSGNIAVYQAAPDLLEALKELVDCAPCQNGCAASDMTCATRKAEAAIAQAEAAKQVQA